MQKARGWHGKEKGDAIWEDDVANNVHSYG